jgi:hypothetical protein
MTKSLTTLAAAALIAGAALTAPSPADARGGRVAAGIIGGIAAGALIAGAAGAYGPYPYGYYGSAPAYAYGPYPAYAPGPYYAPGCYLQRQRVWNGWTWVWQRVRVCY